MDNHHHRKRVPVIVLLTLVLVLATLTPARAVTPVSTAQATTCQPGDKFGPSLAAIQHFFICTLGHKVGIVYVPGGTTPTPSVAEQRGGGSSCEWLIHSWSKVCHHGGPSGPTADFQCIHYRPSGGTGTTWPRDCMAITAMSQPDTGFHLAAFVYGLWHWVKGIWNNKALRRCAFYAVGNVGVAGTILKIAGRANPVALLATTAGGCVTGMLTYWFGS